MMGKVKRDYIVIGMGGHIKKRMSGCPFGVAVRKCLLSKVKCFYNLNDIRVPKRCPLPQLVTCVRVTEETDF